LFLVDPVPDSVGKELRSSAAISSSALRVLQMNVPLSHPDITELEIDYVARVLRSGQLSLGPCVAEFETKFAAHIGARYAIAVNSGTSALHLAIRALGIGSGDEVLTTSFSFVASTNCLLFENALPTFIDIDPDTLNIDPHELEIFIQSCCVWNSARRVLTNVQTGRRVKGILPVHVFGVPCDMDKILEIARQFDLKVIEDACEALGAAYKGRSAGTFGDIGIFAFYPNKQMTTGEGGMIVTDNKQTAMLCRSMRNQGRAPEAEWLCHARLGFNYRLSDVHCALGLAQLERLPELLKGRARVAAIYNRMLAAHPLIKLPQAIPGTLRSWFVYPIQLTSPIAAPNSVLRDRLLRELRRRGIGCQSYFPAIHLQPYFQPYLTAQNQSLPRTEAASQTCLVLPMFSSATEQQIRYVSEAVLEILETELTDQRTMQPAVEAAVLPAQAA
jgi:perosamine synthetase